MLFALLCFDNAFVLKELVGLFDLIASFGNIAYEEPWKNAFLIDEGFVAVIYVKDQVGDAPDLPTPTM